jgi:hypothetical protein
MELNAKNGSNEAHDSAKHLRCLAEKGRSSTNAGINASLRLSAQDSQLRYGAGDERSDSLIFAACYVGLSDLRPAKCVPTKRVKRADAIWGDGKIATRQFRGGRARERGYKDGVSSVAFDRAVDLARKVGCFACACFLRQGGPKIRNSCVSSARPHRGRA